ncbi:MAG: ferritin family protein [Calditrichaeota bacterium]|nr:ferritin family protein [Calditrichota bacterium]
MADIQNSLEALKLALQTEEEGYQLYKKGAEQTQNEFVKNIFRQLFKDELMHTDLIKRFYARLNESGNWAQLSKEEKDYKGLKGEMQTIFSNSLEAVKQGKETISDNDMEVYQKAIEFERNGVKMYTKLYNETADEKARRFYAFLRDMEQDHEDVLDNTYQYLKDPDNWYLKQEGWTLDH